MAAGPLSIGARHMDTLEFTLRIIQYITKMDDVVQLRGCMPQDDIGMMQKKRSPVCISIVAATSL